MKREALNCSLCGLTRFKCMSGFYFFLHLPIFPIWGSYRLFYIMKTESELNSTFSQCFGTQSHWIHPLLEFWIIKAEKQQNGLLKNVVHQSVGNSRRTDCDSQLLVVQANRPYYAFNKHFEQKQYNPSFHCYINNSQGAQLHQHWNLNIIVNNEMLKLFGIEQVKAARKRRSERGKFNFCSRLTRINHEMTLTLKWLN